MELTDRVRRRRARDVGEGEDRERLSVHRRDEWRLPGSLVVREEAVAKIGEAVGLGEGAIADPEVVAFDDRVDALSGERLETLGLGRRESLGAGRVEDRAGQRMLGSELSAGDEAQRVVLPHVGTAQQIGHLGSADRERAGLVERDGVHAARRLEGLGALDQDAA